MTVIYLLSIWKLWDFIQDYNLTDNELLLLFLVQLQPDGNFTVPWVRASLLLTTVTIAV